MDQTAPHAMKCEVVQMLARLAETRAAHKHGADPEFTVDEMIERDTGRRDVVAGVGSGELDPAPFPLGVEHAAEKRFDSLNFDQGAFAPAEARFFRVQPGPGEIPIALEPASRNARTSAIDRIGADASAATWMETTVPFHMRRS